MSANLSIKLACIGEEASSYLEQASEGEHVYPLWTNLMAESKAQNPNACHDECSAWAVEGAFSFLWRMWATTVESRKYQSAPGLRGGGLSRQAVVAVKAHRHQSAMLRHFFASAASLLARVDRSQAAVQLQARSRREDICAWRHTLRQAQEDVS